MTGGPGCVEQASKLRLGLERGDVVILCTGGTRRNMVCEIRGLFQHDAVFAQCEFQVVDGECDSFSGGTCLFGGRCGRLPEAGLGDGVVGNVGDELLSGDSDQTLGVYVVRLEAGAGEVVLD